MLYSDGSEDVKREVWEDPHIAKAKTRKKWKGRSVFVKKKASAGPVVRDGVDTSGAPITPGSTTAMRASLSTLRTELARAQRQDPRLADIIACLKREPAGAYLAEPRMPEGRRTRVRSYQYRLASDGVLVARKEDDLSEDRPVVPELPFASPDKKTPRTMIWKHLLLGVVHNTSTGHHRSAHDMATELEQLVAWWPPEDLRKDCETWYGRCKLCIATHRRPWDEAPYAAVSACKPFYRLQIELMDVSPKGPNGESFIFTALCVATQ